MSAVEHAAFQREEMSEFIDNRFWAVLPYRTVTHLPNLQLSPAAVKEECERKPRLLCDHSWYPVNYTMLPQIAWLPGRVGEHRVIEGVPRMVTEESGLAFALFFPRGWRELKGGEMRDGTVRQNGPKRLSMNSDISSHRKVACLTAERWHPRSMQACLVSGDHGGEDVSAGTGAAW